MRFLEVVWRNWWPIFAGGVVLALLCTSIPKGKAAATSALLRSLARLAIAIPLALVLGVPVAFCGLVFGTMAALLALGILLLVLTAWSCIPLLELLEKPLDRFLRSEGSSPAPSDMEGR